LTLKDAKVSHLSTWMIVKDQTLKMVLGSVCGDGYVPITIKLRHFGKEDTLRVYNNMLLEDLMGIIGEKCGKDPRKVTVKVHEDTVIRRIDR
jgi:hypothetical protein